MDVASRWFVDSRFEAISWALPSWFSDPGAGDGEECSRVNGFNLGSTYGG